MRKTYARFPVNAAAPKAIIVCDLGLTRAVIEAAAPYPTTAKPVFVGHYWLSAKVPGFLADNVACLDYSVAKDGFLCAYRWQGEQTSSNDNFVWGDGGRTRHSRSHK
jgi:hypothetical protein